MIDWEGLLKFSLNYSDGTKKSEFKQMSQQDKKWLEQAMNHYCNSQIQRLKQILSQLDQDQQKQDPQNQLALLQQLQDILDSLDKGSTLYNLRGHITLLKIIFYSKNVQSRIIALQIIASCNQNDSRVQTQSINTGALQLAELIQKQTNIKVKQAMIGTISALIRGQNLQAKRIFIRIGGLQLLKQFLLKNQSKRLTIKIYTLIRDLNYYDDRLHYTFNDLSAFSNTNDIKMSQEQTQKKKDKNGLYYDVNKQYVQKNEIEQNKKYRGIIKKFLNQNFTLKEAYQSWYSQQLKIQKQN